MIKARGWDRLLWEEGYSFSCPLDRKLLMENWHCAPVDSSHISEGQFYLRRSFLCILNFHEEERSTGIAVCLVGKHNPCPHFEQLEQKGVRDLKTAHLKSAMPSTILIVLKISPPSYVIMTLWVIIPIILHK